MKKIAIITGANAGLGLESAKAFVAEGIEVVMACRNLKKAEKAKKEIETKYKNAQLKLMELNLASLASIRSFAEEFKKQYAQLDILLNNAGVMIPPYQKTEDGFELQFGVNYLGHFLLTGLLLEHLEKSEIGGRVVNLSSLAHKWGDIYFKDLQFEKKYDKEKAYGQSKLACLMFAYELDRRLKNNHKNITSIAVHPGLSRTNLFRHLTGFFKVIIPFVYPFTQSAEQGAQTEIKAALDMNLEGGEYLGPGGFKEFSGKPKIVDSNKISKDEAKAKKLWQVSEKLVGEKFL